MGCLRPRRGGMTAVAPSMAMRSRNDVESNALSPRKAAWPKACQQIVDAVDIVALIGEEDETHQIAERVDQGGDLGGQASARAPHRPISSPPLRRSRAGGRGRWCRP